MRKSAAVLLVLSGALVAGCHRSQPAVDDSWGDSSQSITNNTYRQGLGYYHAPYGAWFPMPYNSFRPGQGYYHGGQVTPTPNESTVTESRPRVASSYVNRGGFGSRSSAVS